jgi:hypothetical protein
MPNFKKLLLPGLILLLLATGTALAAASQASPAQVSPNLTKGAVVETMNSGGYTYLCLEKNGRKSWAAIPATQVTLGEEVEIADGMVMKNFTSKSLGRTFEAILFSRGLVKP